MHIVCYRAYANSFKRRMIARYSAFVADLAPTKWCVQSPESRIHSDVTFCNVAYARYDSYIDTRRVYASTGSPFVSQHVRSNAAVPSSPPFASAVAGTV